MGGFARTMPDEEVLDSGLISKAYLQARMVVAMGAGRGIGGVRAQRNHPGGVQRSGVGEPDWSGDGDPLWLLLAGAPGL